MTAYTKQGFPVFETLCDSHSSCGCEQGGTCCLECPLVECVLVSPPPNPLVVRARKLREKIIALDRGGGLTRGEVAAKVGCSVRSVTRARSHA
ncbi:hypothetical protein LCGC14_1089310 [marine sediment metagenome]|uniref:Helix-turn-helix type 11 domain-containing protein n=1 Tax=marine sediment metagenome TaxID=412755 RepID=A0A0F9QIU7_9ZZZZ